MHKVTELKQERAALIAKISQLQNATPGAMSEPTIAQIRQLESEVDRLAESAAIAERQERREAELRVIPENRVGGPGIHSFNIGSSDEHKPSLTRAIRSAASGRLDGIEGEYSQEEARRTGRAAEGFYYPLAALQTRDLTAGVAGEGGNLFAPEIGGFIDALRPKLVIARMGATVLGNLTGDVKLPRQAAASSATWKAETTALDEVSPTFAQVSLTPKKVGAFSELSKQLLVQTSGGVEKIVRNDLLSAIAVAIDQAAISGSGIAPIPTGILSTGSIGNVALGAAGVAPVFDNLIDLFAVIANADADMGTISFLSNPKVRAKLQKTIFDAGSGLNHLDKAQTLGSWYWSSLVPSNLVKGGSGAVCSAIIAGDFSQVVIGQFGQAADIVVDPFTKATEGVTRVVINTYADIAVRRPAYFAAILDALTT